MTACYERNKVVCPGPPNHSASQACGKLPYVEKFCVNVLHAAAYGRQADVVAYLVNELNIDVNSMSAPGRRTALHWVYDSYTVYW